MADFDENISDEEKVNIAMHFLTHSPPGEFSEVFNDVRVLLGNDALLQDSAGMTVAKYNADQFTPTKVEGVDDLVLITPYNTLDDGKYFDPRSKKKFRYNHLTHKASDVESDSESEYEEFRAEVDRLFRKYIEEHYNHGSYAVYSKADEKGCKITLCIESHLFQPNNYWNGRWRSDWCATIDPEGGTGEIVGILKNQVHYYEDGNVQLVSQKECKKDVSFCSKETFAKEFVKIVTENESNYQGALSENYQMMSDTTFKALRRQLPVTRSKVDWNKILGYKIGKEIAK